MLENFRNNSNEYNIVSYVYTNMLYGETQRKGFVYFTLKSSIIINESHIQGFRAAHTRGEKTKSLLMDGAYICALRASA